MLSRGQKLIQGLAQSRSEQILASGQDFAEIAAEYGPFDLTMLEIGAFHLLWADIHIGPYGAARSFQAMGSHGLLMPIHWGRFDLALYAWEQPIERMIALASQDAALKLWSPIPGKPTEVEANVPLLAERWR